MRGQPDYGAYAAGDLVSLTADVAELAARLDSLMVFDRRGKMVYSDDFESPVLRWLTGITLGSKVEFDWTYPKSGAQCVKLTPKAAANSIAEISKEIGVITSQRLGLELGFANPSTELSFYIELAYFDGTDFYRGSIKLDFSANKVYLRTGGGVWTEYAAILAFYNAGYSYYPFKIVVDFETKKYVRAMLQGLWYDLSAYDIAIMAGAGAQRLQQTAHATNETGVAGSVYVDDVIFTQEEP